MKSVPFHRAQAEYGVFSSGVVLDGCGVIDCEPGEGGERRQEGLSKSAAGVPSPPWLRPGSGRPLASEIALFPIQDVVLAATRW
jgi:hypothetical protein